jgi:hypothetical protein
LSYDWLIRQRLRIEKFERLCVHKVDDVAHCPLESLLQDFYGGIASVEKQNRVVEAAERMLERQRSFIEA